eukprot:1142394-Pelagomonas_calceolata.AAC.5
MSLRTWQPQTPLHLAPSEAEARDLWCQSCMMGGGIGMQGTYFVLRHLGTAACCSAIRGHFNIRGAHVWFCQFMAMVPPKQTAFLYLFLHILWFVPVLQIGLHLPSQSLHISASFKVWKTLVSCLSLKGSSQNSSFHVLFSHGPNSPGGRRYESIWIAKLSYKMYCASAVPPKYCSVATSLDAAFGEWFLALSHSPKAVATSLDTSKH